VCNMNSGNVGYGLHKRKSTGGRLSLMVVNNILSVVEVYHRILCRSRTITKFVISKVQKKSLIEIPNFFKYTLANQKTCAKQPLNFSSTLMIKICHKVTINISLCKTKAA